MKKNYHQFQKGFSTLEILIAVAILLITLVPVVGLLFGSQSMFSDSQANSEAARLARQLVERAQASARLDFNLVNPCSTPCVPTSVPPCYRSCGSDTGFFNEKMSVEHIDYYTKKITARVAWVGDANRSEYSTISALISNPDAAQGGGDSTCNSELAGNWKNPAMTSYEFGKDLLHDPSSDFLINGIDVYENKLYAAADITHGNNLNTFFVFDLSDPAVPVLAESIDNNPAVSAGLSAICVSEGYAYVASAYGAPFNTCNNLNGTNKSCGQMQVIDLALDPPAVVYTFKVPGVSGHGGQSVGQSLVCKNGIVYLGLAKNPGAGQPEFNIIDVGGGSAGGSPAHPVWMGGYAVGSGVNDILVKGNIAYIASVNNHELMVLDISDKAFPVLTGGRDLPDNSANGKSLYLLGNSLFLGRTVGVSPAALELYVLDVSNPNLDPLPDLGTLDAKDGASNTSINGLAVRDYLLFLITNNQFQVWKINDTAAPWTFTQWASPLNFPSQGGGNSKGTAIDCENNYFYVGSLPSGNLKGSLSVITGS